MPQPRLDTRPPLTPGAALVSVDGRTYPLRSAAIVARAEGGLALTTLTQEFHNPHAEPLEVQYTLPLPADGAVVGYTVRVGARVIRGEIEKREEAQQAYARALAEGRAAGLLEQDRDDTFTQSLGSIPPAQDVQVEIAVLHRLDFVPSLGAERARWEYRFPTVVGVRYEGAPGRVADAGRLDVDRAGEGEIPARVALDLTVADGSTATLAVASATHDVRCRDEGGLARVALAAGARLDRDLVVRWNACTEQVGARLVEGPGLVGDDGRYALLSLTPPAVATTALARDLTVLIDASGSMSGAPLDLAKQVVQALIESLERRDRFEVIAFADRSSSLTGGLRSATPEHCERAIGRLSSLTAGGATEMADALIEALKPLRQDSQRQVVLVTDGYVGFESEVVGEILNRLPRDARVHTVGLGAAPARAVTRAVSRAGRGVEVLAHDQESATAAARRLCRATVRPVLTELALGGDGLKGSAPQRPTDVLGGQPLVVALELNPKGGMVEVSGREAGTAETWIWRISVPASSRSEVATPAPTHLASTPLPLGALYGREVIADLELEAAATRSGKQVERRIERAGLRHRITSRLTSLVAVAEEPSVDPKLPRRREKLAVEVPAGVSAEGSGLLMGGTRMYGAIEAPGAMRLLYSLHAPPGGRSKPSTLDEAAAAQAPSIGWTPPPETLVRSGRVLRADTAALTVEFEVPFDGFVLPDGDVNLWLDGATWRIGRVLAAESSPRGPHPAGLWVRLALAIDGHPEWLQARSVELRWLSAPEQVADDRVARQIRLTVAVSAGSAESR